MKDAPNFRSLLGAVPATPAPPPTAPTGRELQELLSPVSCAQFANDYFGRVSLAVKGHARKFEGLFGWEQLRRALARGQSISDKRYNMTAAFTHGEETGDPGRMFDAQYSQVAELLHAGATICISNIHMADPQLARWAQSIRSQLHFTGSVGVHCYVSPDDSGLPLHYDKRVATTLQISGRKVWRYSTESAKPWPDDNVVNIHGLVEGGAAGGRRPPAQMEFKEVELAPGDVLCLPAGAWHSARGVGHSLALNLYFAPRNFIQQLLPRLEQLAATSGDWRGGPPASIDGANGALPPAVAGYMRARLEELQQMAREILESPDEVADSWLSALVQEPYTGWQPAAVLPIPNTARDHAFRFAAGSLEFVASEYKVSVPSEHGLILFPPGRAPIIRWMASKSAGFTASQAMALCQVPGGPTREDLLDCLKTLYENGVLKLA